MNTIEIPDLTLDNLHYESHGLAHLVIWGNLETSRFVTMQGAKAAISYEYLARNNPRALGARLFAWNEVCWKQIL
jgi:hypothetical protein